MNDANNGSKLYLYSITTVAILGGLLFGYDTAVISGAEKGLEAFFLMATDFQYDKVMHGITSSSALIGCVIGGALSGFFASRLGRRNSLRLASVLFFLSALGSYYPEFLFFNYGEPNMELLIAFNLYRVLGGIGVGLASAVCPMYIAEIAPSNIRGTLVSCNQFAIIFGMLVVYFVNFLIMGDHTNPIIDKSAEGILSVNAASDMWSVQTGWRYMFGSEAFPAALFGFLLFFVPKTPRYLVLVHQDEKAYSILEKVNGANKAKEILADAGYQDTDGDGILDKDGVNLSFKVLTYSYNDNCIQLADMLQAELSQIGIELSIETQDVLDDPLASGDFDLAILNYAMAPIGTPSYFINMLFTTGASNNYGGYSNEKVDALAAEIGTTSDNDKVVSLTRELEQQVLDDMPFAFVADQQLIFVYSNKVKGVQINPTEYYLVTNTLSVEE